MLEVFCATGGSLLVMTANHAKHANQAVINVLFVSFASF